MPYFIDIERRQVVVMPPGATSTPGQIFIDAEIAAASDLHPGQVLTEAQASALLDGSPIEYRAASPQAPPLPSPRPAETQTGSQRSRPTRSATAARASGVAGVVEGMAWFFLVASVLGGILLTVQTRTDAFGFKDHPYVVAGVTIAIGGAFQALVVIMIAAYIKARTEQ